MLSAGWLGGGGSCGQQEWGSSVRQRGREVMFGVREIILRVFYKGLHFNDCFFSKRNLLLKVLQRPLALPLAPPLCTSPPSPGRRIHACGCILDFTDGTGGTSVVLL